MFLFKWIRALYDKTLKLADHPQAIYWLAFISFVESSFFPIPPDVLLLPLCLANRQKAFLYASVCTGASILGGLLGYGIGFYFFDTLGLPIIEFYGAAGKYDLFQEWYRAYGSIMVVVAGFTPIPYKVITISAGVFKFPIIEFLVLSIASRGLRFAIEAWVVKKWGEPALDLIDKHFNKLTLIAGILLVGGFLVLKFFLPH